MLPLPMLEEQQIPLIYQIHSDDESLLKTIEGEWFQILYHFEWKGYREIGAEYYDALYDFNQNETPNDSSELEGVINETIEEARERLLFDRATMEKTKGKPVPIIYQGKIVEPKAPEVDPKEISPGVVPFRRRGKKAKCFFSLLKSFLGAVLMGFPSEPDKVFLLLKSNPSFVRVCGFAPKSELDEYCYKHVPSLRKLEQFDQIMTEYGLWDKIKKDEVLKNIKSGLIKKENELVGDTTHYHAYSSFETVKYEDEAGKEKKKSQSKPTKNCRCQDRDNCSHDWQLSDEGAGTVVKSKTKMYWAHKASVIGLPKQGIPLDAVAISDGATNDGKTFFPHVEQLFQDYPEIKPWIDTVLYDSACDDKQLKSKFKNELEIELKASMNPRGKKEITKDLPRGIAKITPYGVPICDAGIELEYKGIRFLSEKFIYQAPITSDGTSSCLSCNHRMTCCPNSTASGRTITIAFDTLPHVDPNDPPMAKRFKAIMKRRPSVERMIKRLKCDLGDDRLTKRGNGSFQATLDKTMIAFHILLRHV